MSRIPVSGTAAHSCSSSAAPSGPDSRKPLASTTAPATPTAASARSAAGTARAGNAISATSTPAGSSAMPVSSGSPSTVPPRGFTACTGWA